MRLYFTVRRGSERNPGAGGPDFMRKRSWLLNVLSVAVITLFSSELAQSAPFEKKFGLDLDKYCKKAFGSDWNVFLKNKTSGAWACVWSKDSNESRRIAMEDVCQQQFGTPDFGNDNNKADGWYCKVKIDYKGPCQKYAAVAHEAAVLAVGIKHCTFDPNRFGLDYKKHFDWCVATADAGHIQNIINEGEARSKDIVACAEQIRARGHGFAASAGFKL